MIPEEKTNRRYRSIGKKVTRDFRQNVKRVPKVRIQKLDGSGEKQYDYLPDLERSEGQKTWDLAVIQGYVARMVDQVKLSDLTADRGKKPSPY